MSEEQTNAPIRTIIHPLNIWKGTFVQAEVKHKYRYVVKLLMDYDDDDDYAPIVGMNCLQSDSKFSFRQISACSL